MIRQQYDEIWQDAERVRAFVDEWAQLAPELFSEDFDQGYCLHGFGRESRKLPGLKLRKIVLADGTPYWLRPSFVTSYMTGTVDQLAYPLLLTAYGVPPRLSGGGRASRRVGRPEGLRPDNRRWRLHFDRVSKILRPGIIPITASARGMRSPDAGKSGRKAPRGAQADDHPRRSGIKET